MPVMTLFGMYVDDVGNGSHLFDCFVSMVLLYDRYLYLNIKLYAYPHQKWHDLGSHGGLSSFTPVKVNQ
jgi:hypothetical protein